MRMIRTFIVTHIKSVHSPQTKHTCTQYTSADVPAIVLAVLPLWFVRLAHPHKQAAYRGRLLLHGHFNQSLMNHLFTFWQVRPPYPIHLHINAELMLSLRKRNFRSSSFTSLLMSQILPPWNHSIVTSINIEWCKQNRKCAVPIVYMYKHKRYQQQQPQQQNIYHFLFFVPTILSMKYPWNVVIFVWTHSTRLILINRLSKKLVNGSTWITWKHSVCGSTEIIICLYAMQKQKLLWIIHIYTHIHSAVGFTMAAGKQESREMYGCNIPATCKVIYT